LQLDLSKGLVLGPDVVVNGDFSSSTGWLLKTGATISSGKLNINTTGDVFDIAGQTGILTQNRWYRVTVVCSSYTSGILFVALGDAGGGARIQLSSVGTFTALIFHSSATPDLDIRAFGSGGTGPVVLELDSVSIKELPGNHRFQSTSANRPVVSARVNLVTQSETFGSDWGIIRASVVTSAEPAPFGTGLSRFLREDTSVSNDHFAGFTATSAATSYVWSVYLKAGTRTWAALYSQSGVGRFFNLATGQLGGTGVWGTPTDSTITSVGNGWYRCTITTALTAGSSLMRIFIANGDGVTGYTGDGTSGIYIWGADLRPTNQGVNLPVYQRVNTSTDYDSTGFPVYIKPNGSNQFMQTNSINFSATDKMTVWQGVRKLSDAAIAVSYELSTNFGSNNGTFCMFAPNPAAANYGFRSRGTATGAVGVASGVSAPVTNVLTGIANIAATSMTIRNNGVVIEDTVLANQGTGNFGNYPAYFYMRAGTSLPFNGNDYGSIARGAASTAAQITDGETYINSKTKAYT
jgi:hypothetical protein